MITRMLKRIFLLPWGKKSAQTQTQTEDLPRAYPFPQPAPVSRTVISPIRARAKEREDRRQAGDIWRRWLAAQRTERLDTPSSGEFEKDDWLL